MNTAIQCQVIETQKLLLKDKQGKVRADLGVSSNDTAVLKLNDSGEKPMALVSVTNRGEVSFAMKDLKGMICAEMKTEDGKPKVVLYDEEGGKRLALTVEPNPRVEFYNRNGALNLKVPSD